MSPPLTCHSPMDVTITNPKDVTRTDLSLPKWHPPDLSSPPLICHPYGCQPTDLPPTMDVTPALTCHSPMDPPLICHSLNVTPTAAAAAKSISLSLSLSLSLSVCLLFIYLFIYLFYFIIIIFFFFLVERKWFLRRKTFSKGKIKDGQQKGTETSGRVFVRILWSDLHSEGYTGSFCLFEYFGRFWTWEPFSALHYIPRRNHILYYRSKRSVLDSVASPCKTRPHVC